MADGPFLWFRKRGSPWGYDEAPRGGFCVNAFVFLEEDDRLLLTKYAPHEAWPRLAGLDPSRVARFCKGWTVPGSHVKLGEHPTKAANRIVTEILGLEPVPLRGPVVRAEFERHPDLPDLGPHYDLTFLFFGNAPRRRTARPPSWLDGLEPRDVSRMAPDEWARQHQDVAAWWLEARTAPGTGAVRPAGEGPR